MRKNVLDAIYLREVFSAEQKGLHILSITVTWALENSIETADSMKSRGYGLQNRTSFSIYHFDFRNKATLVFLILSGLYVIAGAALGGLKFSYYPALNTEKTLFSVSVFAVYFLLFALPIIINIKERVEWKRIQAIHR